MAMEDARVESAFEERVANIEGVIAKHPLHREILCKAIGECVEPQAFAALEARIAAYPEFACALQDPCWFVERLEACGALARAEGFSDISEAVFSATPEALEAASRYSPERRLAALMEQAPAYRDTYVELLSFCGDAPRPYKAIETFLSGRTVLERGDNRLPMLPSVFVDRLEACGVIRWRNGWKLTDEGRDLLKDLKSVHAA